MRSYHDMPFGAALLADGQIRFRLWAPAFRQVDLIIKQFHDMDCILPMNSLADGWFEIDASPRQARPGTCYLYRLEGGLEVPDPASRANPEDVDGPSQVIDAQAFLWHDDSWQGRPWHEAVIYELHIGAFTPEGTFTAALQHLDHLVALGVSAIELMPIADFSGMRNWGYDGVLLFAPDHSYGTPDELKALIQAAHDRGLMVLLDVVYNHFGPEGNYLHTYAPQFFSERHHTPWGSAMNFDGREKRVVRDFFIHNALYWIEEYHFDGLRLDAIHAIADASQPDIVTELAAAVQAGPGSTRHVHIVVENDANNARYLQLGTIAAQWNDDCHHALHCLLTGESDGYYEDYAPQPIRHLARCLAEGFAYQGEPSAFRGGQWRGEPSKHLPPSAFINFIQTHDQIGNRAYGERITQLAAKTPLQIALAVVLLAPSPPLLFMGEEFAAATPFQYFCDFHGELAHTVSEGRRHEFAGFRAFADPAALARIPDPNDRASFDRCKLDWDCLNHPPHREWLDYYQHLLALRRTHIVPHLPSLHGGSEFALMGQTGMIVRWHGGQGLPLTLLANLGAEPILFPLQLQGTPFFFSQVDLPNLLSAGHIPPWCALWMIGDIQP